MTANLKPSPQLVHELKDKVKGYIYRQNYETAAFWAEKLLYITNDPNDAYERAQCLFNLKEYHRAAHTIESRKFHLTDLPCLHMAAQCHFLISQIHKKQRQDKDIERKEKIKEALRLLESSLVTNASSQSSIVESNTTFIGRHSMRHQNSSHQQTNNEDRNINEWLGSIYLLKGKIYEDSGNRQMAELAYKEALMYDVFCYEAFTCLTRHQMLTPKDEQSFLKDLNSNGQFPDTEMGELVKLFYELQTKKYHKPSKQILPSKYEYLSKNVDIETALAERFYFNTDYNSALELSASVLQKDAHHMQCLPIYIATSVEMDRPMNLFRLGHQLVDLFPDRAISRYAVGCYYLAIHKVQPPKIDDARENLRQATSLDNLFGPAWLAYGHSFAIEKDHDQAMSAYFSAYHLMPGCHLPLLFIAVEYGQAGDCKLAEKFIQQAKDIAPDDPYVLHEYGVILYRTRSYEGALCNFKAAEKILKEFNSSSKTDWMNTDNFKPRWEPLINNIGHTLRQLGRYDEAIEYFNRALSLVGRNASTCSALGFLYYLKGDWDRAIEILNNALSMRPNDSIASSLLDKTTAKYNEALQVELVGSSQVTDKQMKQLTGEGMNVQ